MVNSLPTRKLWFYLCLIWLMFGLLSHVSAILFMLQYDEEVTLFKVFDVGFYYYVPVLLWMAYTPFLIRLYLRWPLSGLGWRKYLMFHVLFSIGFAPIARALAIFLDFSIKYLIGMEDQWPWEILYEARFILLASAPRAFLSYWLMIGVMIAWEYFIVIKDIPKKNEVKNEPQTIVVPYKNSKHFLEPSDIIWVEANKNYVLIYTKDQTYRLRQSLSSFYENLDKNLFFQVHRSRIVNRSAIASLSHWRRGEYLIRLKNNKLIGTGRSYLDNIKLLLSV